jgi:hypothetical protein
MVYEATSIGSYQNVSGEFAITIFKITNLVIVTNIHDFIFQKVSI